MSYAGSAPGKRPAADPAPSGKVKKAKAGAEKATAVAEASPPGKAKKPKAGPEKRASESPLAGKAKKDKAEPEKAPSDATPAGKAKNIKAEQQKAASEATPAGKGKKGKTEPEKQVVLDALPSSSKSEKPSRALRLWGKNDEMKILEALAAHVKSEGMLPKTDFLLSTVCDRLERKNCTYSDIYEKVRQLKGRYEKAVSTDIVPSNENELQMYNLSEAVWGEKAKEAIAAVASKNDGAVTKSKKGQANKGKMDGNSEGGAPKEAANSTASQNGDSQKGSKKGQIIKVRTDGDVKSRLSKEFTTTGNPNKSKKREIHNEEMDKDAKSGALKETTTGTQNGGDVKGRLSKEVTTTVTPSKSKKRENHNEEMDKDAKSGALKETTTTGTQNGGDLVKSKRGKINKGKMDIDMDSLMPKKATTANQNGGSLPKDKEGENHDEEIERDANVQGMHKGFDELQKSYSKLAAYVEEVKARHPCGETLKRAFEFIGDVKAQSLDSKVKRQLVLEAKAQIRRADLRKDVLNTLIGLIE